MSKSLNRKKRLQKKPRKKMMINRKVMKTASQMKRLGQLKKKQRSRLKRMLKKLRLLSKLKRSKSTTMKSMATRMVVLIQALKAKLKNPIKMKLIRNLAQSTVSCSKSGRRCCQLRDVGSGLKKMLFPKIWSI